MKTLLLTKDFHAASQQVRELQMEIENQETSLPQQMSNRHSKGSITEESLGADLKTNIPQGLFETNMTFQLGSKFK